MASPNASLMIDAMGGGVPGSGETITVSFNSTTATQSAILDTGMSYELSGSVDFHFCRTENGIDDATTSDAVQRFNWSPVFFTCTEDKRYLSIIGATSSGTAYIVPRTAQVRKANADE